MKKSAKNILLLFTDQQRADTIHALGNEVIQTPALDMLCADSTVYTRCITPSPVCVPARNCLMHGVYPNRAGCNDNGNKMPYSGTSLYGTLTANGYDTLGIGKMHFANDTNGLHGFVKRLRQEEIPSHLDEYHDFLVENGKENVYDYNGHRSEMYYIPQISQLPQSLHPTQWVGDRAVDYIKNYDETTPFFLMASFIHPHPPFSPPAPWNKLYRRGIPLPFIPPESESLVTYHNFLQNQYKGLTVGIDRHLLTQLKAFYYACISFVDYQVLRILNELRCKGLYDDTMIIFTSDHGELLGDYNCLGKRTMLDAACRVPLIIKANGKRGICSDPVSLCDIMPTVLSYAGISYDKSSLDGVDLASGSHDLVFSQYSNGDTGLFAAASAADKLVYSAADDKFFYFDSFPETHNSYTPENPRVKYLENRLSNYIAADIAPKRVVDVSARRADFIKNPFVPLRQDNGSVREKEAAAIPKEYRIDL